MDNKENTQCLHDHGQNLEAFLKSKPSEAEFLKASDIFQQLCDPTRLHILWLLSHSEQCVNNISLAIGMSTSAVSHHLRGLRQTGLLTNRRAARKFIQTGGKQTASLIHRVIDDIFEINCPH